MELKNCKYCGATFGKCELERRWQPVGFGGYISYFCKKMPKAFNIANPSGK